MRCDAIQCWRKLSDPHWRGGTAISVSKKWKVNGPLFPSSATRHYKWVDKDESDVKNIVAITSCLWIPRSLSHCLLILLYILTVCRTVFFFLYPCPLRSPYLRPGRLAQCTLGTFKTRKTRLSTNRTTMPRIKTRFVELSQRHDKAALNSPHTAN